MTPDSRPGLRLSVVIAAWNGKQAVARCLRSLECNTQETDTEVVVVSNFDEGTEAMIRDEFPAVKHVSMPSETTVPQLRTAGIERSRGQIVALAEDHCTFKHHWGSAVKKAHELPYAAIGGAVENASGKRALDWAVYFYDYGKFMLPLTAGIAGALSGNNVSYKRAVLEQVKASYCDGFLEPFVHAELVRRGYPLYVTPSLVVHNEKHHRVGTAVSQAYHLARGYAGQRLLNARLVRRIAFAVGSLILPILLPSRITVQIVRKRRLVGALARALPYLVVLTGSWALGEFCGYVAGAGRSAEKWK